MHSWNINIVPRFQSQIYLADEILKQLQPGDVDQSGENIPAAVKGTLDDIDEKFMQHNDISKMVGITRRNVILQSFLIIFSSILYLVDLFVICKDSSNHFEINYFNKMNLLQIMTDQYSINIVLSAVLILK